jgi:hypothetical protein
MYFPLVMVMPCQLVKELDITIFTAESGVVWVLALGMNAFST